LRLRDRHELLSGRGGQRRRESGERRCGGTAAQRTDGSIDFTPDPGLVHSLGGARGAFAIFTECDVPQAVSARDEWAELRQEVSVVAPSETSFSTAYQ
jgi:hypothetical protein